MITYLSFYHFKVKIVNAKILTYISDFVAGVDVIAFVFSSITRSLLFSAAVRKVANISFNLRGVRATRSRSSAYVMICEDLLKLVCLLSIWTSLRSFSKAMLKRRHASAFPCRNPVLGSKFSERLPCIWSR